MPAHQYINRCQYHRNLSSTRTIPGIGYRCCQWQTYQRPKRRGRRVLQKRLQRLCRQGIPRTLPRPIRRRRTQSLNGVYNMNTRTAGGAITPNIRGITGKGRIPVTLDGTEQTVDVWLNNYGVGDRNYLDPALFRSIAVEKSPALTRGVKSGVGGAMSIRTIEPADIIPRRQKLGNRSQNRVFRQHRGAEKRLAPILRPRLPHPLAHRRNGGRSIGYARCIDRLYRQTFPHRPVVGRRHSGYEVCGRQKPHQLQRR